MPGPPTRFGLAGAHRADSKSVMGTLEAARRDGGSGIHGCLKSICPKGHAGSSPAPGTPRRIGFVAPQTDDRFVHPPHLRYQAIAWHTAGISFSEICQRLGLPRSTISHWLHGERGRRYRRIEPRIRLCAVCGDRPEDLDPVAYPYLLGMYLGDGHLVTSARVPVLRIYCTNEYVKIIEECEDAMRATLAKSVQRVQKQGCVGLQAYSMHWPCLFPQHGPGKKHERNIVLADWQRRIVEQAPKPFLRGLFHSDGCRVVNRITVRGQQYAYPRYFLSNESDDILKLCEAALDRIGAAWRRNRANCLSVARRDSVALLDSFIGPKE